MHSNQIETKGIWPALLLISDSFPNTMSILLDEAARNSLSKTVFHYAIPLNRVPFIITQSLEAPLTTT
jgi:hypothetical protein